MSKVPTNLTLHSKVLEMAGQLQELLGFGSLSTMVEGLIREEYQKRNGTILIPETSALREDSPPYRVSSKKSVLDSSAGQSPAAQIVSAKSAQPPTIHLPEPTKHQQKRPKKPVAKSAT